MIAAQAFPAKHGPIMRYRVRVSPPETLFSTPDASLESVLWCLHCCILETDPLARIEVTVERLPREFAAW